MDISKIQFGQLSQSKGIDKSFEDLDINSDGKINDDDKNLANSDGVKSVITNLLNCTDEEVELSEDASLDFSKLESESETKVQENNDGRVYNQDGTYSKTKTNAESSTIVATYNADDKVISKTVTKKDGTVSKYTYSYNDDGSYTRTAKNETTDKTIITNFDANGKKTTAKSTDKNGVVRNSTYAYDEDGSYTKTTKNETTGATTVTSYNSKGVKTKKVITGQKSKVTITYNEDGSVKSKNRSDIKSTSETQNADGTTTKTTTNKKTGTVTTETYNFAGKLVNSIKTYKDKSNHEVKIERNFNEDGTYTEITNWIKSSLPSTHTEYTHVSIKKYDSTGKEIKSDAELYNCDIDSGKNYKNYINQNGITYVIYGKDSCGKSLGLKEALLTGNSDIVKELDLLEGANTIYTSTEEALQQGYEDVSKFIDTTAGMGVPVIVKYVNGKAVGVAESSTGSDAQVLNSLTNSLVTSNEQSVTYSDISFNNDTEELTSKATITNKIKGIVTERTYLYRKDGVKILQNSITKKME